jgi:hypothetical protein
MITAQETGNDEHHNPLTTWGFFFPSTFYSHLYRNYFTEPEPRVNNRRLYHMATKGRAVKQPAIPYLHYM